MNIVKYELIFLHISLFKFLITLLALLFGVVWSISMFTPRCKDCPTIIMIAVVAHSLAVVFGRLMDAIGVYLNLVLFIFLQII